MEGWLGVRHGRCASERESRGEGRAGKKLGGAPAEEMSSRQRGATLGEEEGAAGRHRQGSRGARLPRLAGEEDRVTEGDARKIKRSRGGG